MSDIMRTALKGGGRIHITIDARQSGDFELRVTEEWERLIAVENTTVLAERLIAAENTTVLAEQLAVAEDPDAVIREELTRMVRKAHMNWGANRMAKAL